MAKHLLDQSAHFLIGLAVAWIATVDPYGGAVVGLSLGLTREVTEGGNILSDGSLLDMCFWTLGGAIGGAL